MREALDILRRVAPMQGSPFSSPHKTANTTDTSLLDTLKTINRHLFAASKQPQSPPPAPAIAPVPVPVPASPPPSGGMWGQLTTKSSLPTTPAPSTPVATRVDPSSASASMSMITPGSATCSSVNRQAISREVVKLKNDLMHEKHQYTELYQEHADLLECLAQQEVELGIYKDELEACMNTIRKLESKDAVNKKTKSDHKSTHERIKEMVIEKYGSYIEFR